MIYLIHVSKHSTQPKVIIVEKAIDIIHQRHTNKQFKLLSTWQSIGPSRQSIAPPIDFHSRQSIATPIDCHSRQYTPIDCHSRQSIASSSNRLVIAEMAVSDRMYILCIFLHVKPILTPKILIKHIYTHIVKVRYSPKLRGCLVATKMPKSLKMTLMEVFFLPSSMACNVASALVF